MIDALAVLDRFDQRLEYLPDNLQYQLKSCYLFLG